MLGNPAISLYLILISQTQPYGSIHQPPPHHNNPPAVHGEAMAIAIAIAIAIAMGPSLPSITRILCCRDPA